MVRPPWSRGQRREHDRFARAVDAGHDPEFSEELAVVAALRRLGEEVPLDPETRGRIAERTRPGPEPRKRRRLVPVLAAAIALLLAVTGLGVLLAENALPGDSLYHVKRARESVVLGLTFDEEARALKRLDYGAARLDELTVLMRRGHLDGEAYAVGFADFAVQTRTAVTELTALATSSDGHHLGPLRTWATAQATRIAAIHRVLPGEAAEPKALLMRVESRAEALADRMACYRITSGRYDELGALPATGACGTPETLRRRPTRSVPASPVPPPEPPPVEDAVTSTATGSSSRTPGPPDALPTPTGPPATTTTVPVPEPLPGPFPTPTSPRLPSPSTPPSPPVFTLPPLLPGLLGVSNG
ncbi:DUF5667 domain-containing protein [Prauserella oleivorans]|uniref:DUF5667 domain-containing protein n=1 Tax=Prauserella oleivorans TaxID=1478153 RepID=A0ABW5W298_9PSEU